jgi:AcrR family transcriptional regulator
MPITPDRAPTVGTRPVGSTRPGGRAARVRAAILAATIDHLADHSWDDVSVDEIAATAGVHRTTVYRRWPTREALFLDAASEHAATTIPIPDTGSLQGDLESLARSIAAELGSPTGRAWLKLAVRGAFGDHPLDGFRQQFLHDRHVRFQPVIDRAIGRGEIRSGTSPVEVSRVLCSPLYTRLLVTGEPVDEAAAAQAAAITLTAVTAGLL